MLQAARRVCGFVFEVEINASSVEARERQRDQMRIGAALKIRFDFLNGFVRPVSLLGIHRFIVQQLRVAPAHG